LWDFRPVKSPARTTIISFAASLCAVGWLVAAFAIAGVWLDCIPNDSEYGCPTEAAAWERTIAILVAAAVLSAVLWLGTRRLRRVH
jgi:hypothetical protein